MNINTHYMAVQ